MFVSLRSWCGLFVRARHISGHVLHRVLFVKYISGTLLDFSAGYDHDRDYDDFKGESHSQLPITRFQSK